MQKYRKKPIVIEAVQWFPDPEFGYFNKDIYFNKKIGYDKYGVEYTICNVSLRTINGPVNIEPGEWILKGIEGELYPCKNNIFIRLYEIVN